MIIFIFFNVLVSTNLSQDEEVLKQIEREVQMRDGASKLLAACSRREQALEASKNLLTSNARILALLSQLQQMKKNQILHRAGHRSDGAQGYCDRPIISGERYKAVLYRDISPSSQ